MIWIKAPLLRHKYFILRNSDVVEVVNGGVYIKLLLKLN